jgi:hypothetical protein
VVDQERHAACVDAWLRDAGNDLPPDRLLQLFEGAFAALWARTCSTLGEITLGAIVDRVLYTTSEKLPHFSGVQLDRSRGIDCGELRRQVGSLHLPELREGIRFVLVEFLTVLGSLTAEILSPELHGALARVRPGPGNATDGASPDSTSTVTPEDEDHRS